MRLWRSQTVLLITLFSIAASLVLQDIRCSALVGDDVFEAIFSANWTQLNINDSGAFQVPDGQCMSMSLTYQKCTEVLPGSGVYRVPHSRIFANGVACGSRTINASEDELWFDSHMLLASAEVYASPDGIVNSSLASTGLAAAVSSHGS
jgi:hypothetical protein